METKLKANLQYSPGDICRRAKRISKGLEVGGPLDSSMTSKQRRWKTRLCGIFSQKHTLSFMTLNYVMCYDKIQKDRL